MAQTDDGRIWLGTEHRGLFYLQGGRISGVSNGRDDTKINCFLPLQNSELWVGTAKGIRRWNGTELTSSGVPQSFLNLDVLSILRDRDSNIWVGTDRGLFRYNGNGVSLLSYQWTGRCALRRSRRQYLDRQNGRPRATTRQRLRYILSSQFKIAEYGTIAC